MTGMHFVLTLGRSGSNTLVDMINQHPELFNYGEVLGEWNRLRKLQRRLRRFPDDAAYLDFLYRNSAFRTSYLRVRNTAKQLKRQGGDAKRPRSLASVGVKDFSLNVQKYHLQEYLADRPGILVIGLFRSNTLARLVSNEMLKLTGVVLSRPGDGSPERSRLRMSPEAVLAGLETLAVEEQALQAQFDMLSPERRFRIDYEDLYGSPERGLQIAERMYGFLGVTPIEPGLRMGKLGTHDPIDAFETPAPIAEAIAASPFAHLLEERWRTPCTAASKML